MPDSLAQEWFYSLLRILCVAGFLATLGAGFYLFRRRECFFGARADLASENPSSLGYNKFQAVAIWLHVLLMFAMFALFLH
jgi:hypothetical protein